MLKISLYDFDRTIYSRDTGISLYLFLFKKHPMLCLYAPLLLFFTLLYLIKLIKNDTWKGLMLLPMTHFPLSSWRAIVQDFWQKNTAALFPTVLEEIKKDKADGYIVGVISASLELFLEPVLEIVETDFLIGTLVKIEGEKITPVLIGSNCKEEEKVKRFYAYMDKYYQGKEYIVEKMVSDSLHDLPLYKIARSNYTVEKDGTLRVGLPNAYSKDLIIK